MVTLTTHSSEHHYMVVTVTTKQVVNVTTQKIVSIVADISSELHYIYYSDLH